MIRWLAIFIVLLPAAALAQTSAPGVSSSASHDGDPQSASAQALGEHICPGYPDLAAQNMIKGATELAFQITAEGKVSNVVVQSSSGSAQLDAAARLCVMGWLYKPEMQDGKPVAVPGSVRITWTSPDEDGQSAQAKSAMISVPIWKRGGYSCIGWHTGSKLPPHNVVMSFFVETDGSVKDVTVSQSSGDAEADSDAVKCLSERHYEPAKQDGKPLEVHISDWLY
jgi:TonB family protein